MADNNAAKQLDYVFSLTDKIMGTADISSKAIKMILDAQMIDHLIQSQDVEDRKNLLMLGLKDKSEAE